MVKPGHATGVGLCLTLSPVPLPLSKGEGEGIGEGAGAPSNSPYDNLSAAARAGGFCSGITVASSLN